MKDVSFPGRIIFLRSASQETFPFSRNSQDLTSCLFNPAEPPEFTAHTEQFSNQGYRPQQSRGLVAWEIPRSLAESMKVIFFLLFFNKHLGNTDSYTIRQAVCKATALTTHVDSWDNLWRKWNLPLHFLQKVTTCKPISHLALVSLEASFTTQRDFGLPVPEVSLWGK